MIILLLFQYCNHELTVFSLFAAPRLIKRDHTVFPTKASFLHQIGMKKSSKMTSNLPLLL